MIAGQKLDAGAALAPGGDFFDDCLLRPVKPPRRSEVPTIDYVANEVQLFRLMVAQKIEQHLSLAGMRAEMKIRYPNSTICRIKRCRDGWHSDTNIGRQTTAA